MTNACTRAASGALGVAVVFVWSTCFIAIRATAGDTAPMTYAAARALLAAGALMIIAAARGRLRPPAGSWPWLIGVGLTGTSLAFIGMFGGAESGETAIPSVVAGSQALFVAPLAALILKERLDAVRLTGMVIGFVGLTFVVVDASRGLGTLQGSLLALAAAVGLAISIVLAKQAVMRIGPLTLTAWQFVIGSVPLVALALRIDGVPTVDANATWVGGLIYLALISSAGGSLVWNWLLRSSDATRLAALTLLVPPLSLLLGMLVYREAVHPLQWVGVALAFAGVVCTERHNVFSE